METGDDKAGGSSGSLRRHSGAESTQQVCLFVSKRPHMDLISLDFDDDSLLLCSYDNLASLEITFVFFFFFVFSTPF